MNRDAINAIKDIIRAPYAWPGGYPKYLLLSDGECLCKACARSEYRRVLRATRDADQSGWDVVGSDINWNDAGATCAHCYAAIESAYGDGND
jgi:hypothetical protein